MYNPVSVTLGGEFTSSRYIRGTHPLSVPSRSAPPGHLPERRRGKFRFYCTSCRGRSKSRYRRLRAPHTSCPQPFPPSRLFFILVLNRLGAKRTQAAQSSLCMFSVWVMLTRPGNRIENRTDNIALKPIHGRDAYGAWSGNDLYPDKSPSALATNK